MNTTVDKISQKAQRAAASVIIDKVLAMVDKDREKGFLELVDWAEQFWGNGFSKEDYDKVRTAIKAGTTNNVRGYFSYTCYLCKSILIYGGYF